MRTRTKSDRRTLSTSLSCAVLQWLTDQGHSRERIAELVGSSHSYIGVVMMRERSFTLDHMNALSQALHIPMGALLIQVTRRECKTPEEQALVEATDRLLLKADALAEVLRRRLAAQSSAEE